MRPGEPVRDTTGTFGIRLRARTDFPEGTLMSTDDREITDDRKITYVCRVMLLLLSRVCQAAGVRVLSQSR